jgi:hypothetical protein
MFGWLTGWVSDLLDSCLVDISSSHGGGEENDGGSKNL